MRVHPETIALGAFLKWAQVSPTGGQAKRLIAQGQVRVNGRVEQRRSRQVSHGDIVEVGPRRFRVARTV